MAKQYAGDNPLTSKDHADINAALARINQALHDADFLESIGRDVSEQKARLDLLTQELEAYKKRYFTPAIS